MPPETLPVIATGANLITLTAVVYTFTAVSKAMLGHRGKQTQIAAVIIAFIVALGDYFSSMKGFTFPGFWNAFLTGGALAAGAIGTSRITKPGEEEQIKPARYTWKDAAGTSYEYHDVNAIGPPAGYQEAEATGRERSSEVINPATLRPADWPPSPANVGGNSFTEEENSPRGGSGVTSEKQGLGYDPEKEGFNNGA